MRVPKMLALACLIASCASVSIPPKLEVRAAWPRCKGQLCASAPVAPADARLPAPAAAHCPEGLAITRTDARPQSLAVGTDLRSVFDAWRARFGRVYSESQARGSERT